MRRRLVGIVSQVFPSRETTTRKGRSNRTAPHTGGFAGGGTRERADDPVPVSDPLTFR